MMPNKFRLSLFLLLCLVYVGTSIISTASERYAVEQYIEIFSTNPPEFKADKQYFSDALARTAESMRNSKKKDFDALAYRVVIIHYLSVVIWLYLCACLIDLLTISRQRKAGDAE